MDTACIVKDEGREAANLCNRHIINNAALQKEWSFLSNMDEALSNATCAQN